MKCQFFKPDGMRCEANAMNNSNFCFTHNPETKEALHDAAVKGGSMPKKNSLDLPPFEVKNIQDVIILLESTINDIRSGTMPVKTANCLGYLANIVIKALEVSDLEKRIEAIEALMGERKNQVIKYD